MTDNNEDLRLDIKKCREDLKEALRGIPDKLTPAQLLEFRKEMKLVDELLARLETGLIWVTLFGKASVGKSATINSLMDEDVAEVGVEMGTTQIITPYTRYPWKLVDAPGVLDGEILEEMAIAEAKKAHGHIFVIDGEPTEAEMKLFRLVCAATPDVPRLVYCNKWDKLSLPQKEKQILQDRIAQKIGELKIPKHRIVYGSAQLYDPETDTMVRQQITQLYGALYETAGIFGDVINILDPAKRAGEVTEKIRESILASRKNTSRQVIQWFSIAAAASNFFLPLIIATPTILSSMVYLIFLVMGKKEDKTITGQVTTELLKACGRNISVTYVGAIAAVAGMTFVVNPVVGLGVAAVCLGTLSVLNYQRAVILGEVTIEYVLNNCSWGLEGEDAVIRKCIKRAENYYLRLQNKPKSNEDDSDEPPCLALVPVG